jgi:hypothetical protein
MFFFGRKNKKKRPMAAPPRANARAGAQGQAPNQKRTAYRAPVEFDITYQLPGEKLRTAVANDLSAGGLRLVCAEDLMYDSRLELSFTLPSDFLEMFKSEREVEEMSPFGKRKRKVAELPPAFGPMRVGGKVLRPFFSSLRRRFQYGIAFVDAPEHVTEELQRFIHFWQLYQLRKRNQVAD